MQVNIQKNNQGQTLITLLVFTVVAMAIITTAVSIIINISKSASIVESHTIMSGAAESALENAILRVLRDPTYAGESILIGETLVEITVNGTDPIEIRADATYGEYTQAVQAEVSYVNNRLTATSWDNLY